MKRVDGGDPEELWRTGIELGDVPRFHRRDVGVAVTQNETLPGIARVCGGLLGEGGCDEHERRTVGVVLNDLVDEQTDANDGRVLADQRWGRVVEERVSADLFGGVGTEIQMLPEAKSVTISRSLIDDDFVVTVDVRQSALRGGEPVHREEPAVERTDRLEVLRKVGSITHHRRGVEGNVCRRLQHLGPARNRCVDRRVVLAGIDCHRRGVRRAQEPRERRLCSTCPGEREQ